MVKLFVVGIPRDMESDELADIFGEHGQVGKALIITDPETGESKGYGFVDMLTDEGAAAAIKNLDGGSIDGRVISVRLKENKSATKRTAIADKPKPFVPKKKRPRL